MNAAVLRFLFAARLVLALITFKLAWSLGMLPALLLAACAFWSYCWLALLRFLRLPRINADQAVGAPRFRAMPGVWWREMRDCERLFAWAQPFHAQRCGDSVDRGDYTRRGVLLLHGYLCNRGMWQDWMPLLAERGHPCIALTQEPAYGSIDDYADAIQAAYLKLRESNGAAPAIVAHSMGGLALRAWWRKYGGANTPLYRAVTLGTPHGGTAAANLGVTRNAVQMRPGSPWLVALAAESPPGLAARCISYFSHADSVVYPADTAVLAGGEARHRPGLGHVSLAVDPAIMTEVLAELA
ncbi:MAG TPA: alpha/beta fold hydrolase [Burkholderiaceae bacterium]